MLEYGEGGVLDQYSRVPTVFEWNVCLCKHHSLCSITGTVARHSVVKQRTHRTDTLHITTRTNAHVHTHAHTHTHTHTSTHAPTGQRPNGSDDTASGTRGWNCLGTSEGVGDLGPTCNLDRRAFGEYECYDSCGTSCKRDDAGNALNCVAASCWCETPKFEAHPQPKFEAHFQPSRGKLAATYCGVSFSIFLVKSHFHTFTFTLSRFHAFTLSHFHTFALSRFHTFTLFVFQKRDDVGFLTKLLDWLELHVCFDVDRCALFS